MEMVKKRQRIAPTHKSRLVARALLECLALLRCFWSEMNVTLCAVDSELSGGFSMLVVRPFAIIKNCVERIEMFRIGIQPGIHIRRLDWDDAAIMTCGGNLGGWLIGDGGE